MKLPGRLEKKTRAILSVSSNLRQAKRLLNIESQSDMIWDICPDSYRDGISAHLQLIRTLTYSRFQKSDMRHPKSEMDCFCILIACFSNRRSMQLKIILQLLPGMMIRIPGKDFKDS